MLRRVSGWVSGLSAVWLGVLLITSGGAVATGGVMAYRTWDWVEHDNDFCMSCHLMAEPYELFAESAHREMGCKACHKPTLLGRSRMAMTQLLESPEELSVHAEVPNEKCASCHIDGDPEKWALIAQTAGHRVHLESADRVLSGLQCVQCHSSSLHQFAATDQTCAQSGCHTDVEIKLGRMGDFTIHCAACHGFNAPTTPDQDPALALRPSESECLSCHAMRVMIDLPEDEPHGGVCATCHNPHTQELPSDAVQTCATAGCHSAPEGLSPFHRGVPHAAVQDCATCHQAHDFRPDGANCLSCHQDIYNDAGGGAAGAMAFALPGAGAGEARPPAMRLAIQRHGDPSWVVSGHANPENNRWTQDAVNRAGPAHIGTVPAGPGSLDGAAGAEDGTDDGIDESSNEGIEGSEKDGFGAKSDRGIEEPAEEGRETSRDEGSDAAARSSPPDSWGGDSGDDSESDSADFEVVERTEALIAVAPPRQAVADTTFRHANHRGVDCTSCHSTAEEHGTVTVTTTTDCRGCHHSAPLANNCAACHSDPIPTAGLSIQATLAMSVGQPRARQLPFSHQVHTGTSCQSCHVQGIDQPVTAESCASCHQDHHGPDPTIDCAQCHQVPPRSAHTTQVHMGCGGAGCHTSASTPVPPRNRLGCLACHQDKREHQPGGECVECHVLPPVRRGEL